MRCCVPGCKSDSRYSLKSLGITFYMLPSEPSLRNAWFQVLGIEEPWKPNERPAVCSEHFLCEDLFQDKSGLLTLRVDSVPFTVQVCRICLVMGTKLFSIREYKLEQAYEQLTGVSLLSENCLPHELCAECAQRLINFSRFRHKSLKANSLMMELLNKHKEITELNIQSISRENNQLISNLTTATIIDHYDFCIEEVDDEEVEIIPEEVKPVVTPDLDTTINAEENNEDVEVNNDILTSNYDESDVKDDDYSTDNSSLLEETKKKGVKYIQYEKDDENEEAINNIVLNKNNESDVIDDNSFSDNSLLLEETKKSKEYRRNAKVKTNNRAETKVDGQKKTLLDEILKIFTVTDLTLKEQLADIENRKESLNYKNSPFKASHRDGGGGQGGGRPFATQIFARFLKTGQFCVPQSISGTPGPVIGKRGSPVQNGTSGHVKYVQLSNGKQI
ncbi:unnamed protein product [Diatraea saccharalis]|uniref:Uncharacterized protein n=1 Tax=Diatraea saccharalis TaxID=40085 RepID=A0A9N9R5K6_9NEOP|nr:unnamed protein product [Diatraea saccharalis]